jgi:predicted ribosomally synthesized peptide with nif11-like leader
MSKENLEQFMEQVAGSEELQAKIGEEIDAEALIALGAECGCEFTAEELQESAELSEEELDGVAGGVTSRTGGRGMRVKLPMQGVTKSLGFNIINQRNLGVEVSQGDKFTSVPAIGGSGNDCH